MVLLIGNYPLDRQQSMLRFANMMVEGLATAGVPTELIQPRPLFGSFTMAGGFVAKWLGYIDKFLIFPRHLRARLEKGSTCVVHICDHSNAMYAKHVRGTPVVVTCHDLLAVRGARGEATDTPASATGKFLQRWIVSGLRSAAAVPCISQATLRDAQQIVTQGRENPKLELITLGLNYPYRELPETEVQRRLNDLSELRDNARFALHVGSNLRRKNREAVLRIFASVADQWDGRLVFAGEELNPSLRSQAAGLGIADRVVEVRSPGNELLEVLYNRATALLFPSRFEGFGWPIAEAEACGCPVICSATPPMDEVGGAGALLRDVEDEAGFASDLLRLADPAERSRWSTQALESAERFATDRMIAKYCTLYRSLAPAC
ncbi:MAG: glycosyltransferase [Chthoniobacterales bacterium]|nr:glycosyltransferase [Chthoniobacterales bacterium]